MAKRQMTAVELRGLQTLMVACANEDRKTQDNLKPGRTRVPSSCPSCGTPYAKEFKDAIKRFLDFYLAVKDSAFKTELQLREEAASDA